MRKTVSNPFAASLLGLLVLALLSAVSPPPAASGEPDSWWHTDYAAALKEAKAKQLPVLVVFR